jgi:glycosyltransferase involved in cell wall biosynthesis
MPAGSPVHVVSVQTTNEKGGGEYANVNLLDALARRGFRVKLLTNVPELAVGTAVPVREVDLGPKLSRRTIRSVARAFLPGTVRLARALREEAEEAPIDVLLLHYKKEQLMSMLLPRSSHRAVAWAEWGPVPFPLRAGPLRAAYVAASRRARLVIAVSESTRASLVEVGVNPRKIVVVPPLVDSGAVSFDAQARSHWRSRLGAGNGEFVVGCISRLNVAKRNDVIIDALGHLPDDVMLVLAGSGEDEPKLRERARPFGGRVRFLPTPRGHVHEVLSACDVQVFAPQVLEGLPRAIVFGQLTERPIIVTDETRVRDLVPPGTGVAIAPPNDPAALAASVLAYRADPERRAREGEAGRRFALVRYDADAAAERLYELISSLAERARSEAGQADAPVRRGGA